jgi:hypothetical protein
MSDEILNVQSIARTRKQNFATNSFEHQTRYTENSWLLVKI